MLSVEYRKVETLIPYARNPRTHSADQIAQIAASIVEYGWTSPILVDGDNGILAGHGRFAAARQLGLAEVPVIELGHLSPTQKRAYLLSDNRTALGSGWDEDLLAVELSELADAGYDLALTGFDQTEIERLLALTADEEPAEADSGDAPDAADAVPETPTNPVSRTGDVWLLGAHRLICGDAADPVVVGGLMGQDRANLLVTSPPYANQRAYTTGGIADWDRLMQGVFAVAMTVLAAAGQMLVNLGLVHREGSVVRYWDDWLSWMPRQGWRFFGWYVWDQGVTVPGDWAGRLAPRHEFLFHFNREARKPNKTVPCKFAGEDKHLRPDGSSSGGLRSREGEHTAWNHAGKVTQEFRIPDSVVTATRQRGSIGEGLDHPAVFPVALPQFVIEGYTDPGDIVLDPFGGSGTTLLAAQRSSRIARVIEIAPEYVDVAIKRFRQNFPAVQATLLATGQTFDEVAAERGISSGSAPGETRFVPP
ncbi:site-specific DNA-methyltransferase [Accumulibacter sp.]|uniref:site-specific DNA-methyltransferase n=1 Tax=Accumulibacter sp. TaxID=2053492 RepID=UPI0025F66E26|nr:site-specific DNA-methyltransferase [Accumulibacter sp.]MCM8595160.1 site-specific DNA-methyltransferase [Accumulibacter sp.]MCM8626177.1 site-specific DNA-methyltransferase [Accumulibacter sp.]MDS4049306.1 site-specific DNA-methyltransferase [Accumulibacter sp.]